MNNWITDRNPNKAEFLKAYVRAFYGAEFIVAIKGADRPTTLYYNANGAWLDEEGKEYQVEKWMPLPDID